MKLLVANSMDNARRIARHLSLPLYDDGAKDGWMIVGHYGSLHGLGPFEKIAVFGHRSAQLEKSHYAHHAYQEWLHEQVTIKLAPGGSFAFI